MVRLFIQSGPSRPGHDPNRVKPGLAGGPDGFLPQHLLDLTGDSLGEAATKLLNTITNFMNQIMFPGKVPSDVCKILFGAILTALSKQCRGIRPIAVGLIFRRLQGWTEGHFLRPKQKQKEKNLLPSAKGRSRSRRFEN